MSSTNMNFEEDSGVVKSGPVIAGFAPIKSRKNYYAVLCERALELHDSEKAYRKRKPARFLIDLSIAFNLHNEHFDPKLKRCVCLMGPDETLCLKVDDVGKGDEGRQNAEWYNAIMSVLIPSRVLRLGRPIQPQEFFECAWDVEVVNAPKIKRPGRSEEPLQNICIRLPEIAGQKRLCFYAHTIVVCKRRIEPALCGTPPSGIPPFHIDDFIEIPRKCVAFFGCQERFFLMRLGRGAPMGASELWAQCDSEEVAHDIHNKLNVIIERESEKKRKMNNGIVMPPGLLSLRSYHTHHRERPHNQPLRQRASSFFTGRVGSLSCTSSSVIGRKPSDSSGTIGQALGNRASSISYDPRTQSGNSSTVKNLMSIFPNHKISEILTSQGSCGLYQQMKASSNVLSSSSLSTNDETENSGSTICTEVMNGSHCEVVSSSQPLSEKNGGTCEIISNKEIGDRCREKRMEKSCACNANSCGLQLKHVDSRQHGCSSNEGYTPMHAAEWSAAGNERYKLEEVRSYVSDSSESCYSSIATTGCSVSQAASSAAVNPPRAYSFAGRCNFRSAKNQDNVVDNADLRGDTACGGLIPPTEDPRKRAFSLGSKTLFPRPFRKISQHSSRQQRHSQTSASGASLASSEVSSSFGPSSSSANYLTSFSCSEKEEGPRNRSGSFGSGHSTSYNRRGSSGGARDGADHFVEMDFGSGIGRSGSGSVASVESPNRSRTSSFGCSIRKDTEMFSYLTELPDALLTPSQIVLQQARQSSIDESFDYVSTDAPDLIAVKNALAVATHEHSNGHYHSFLSTTDSKSIDVRSSQHFETIEENASLKSSLSSSRSSISVDVEAEQERQTELCRADSGGDIDHSRYNARQNASAMTSSFGSCCTPSDRSASNPLYEINELHPFQTFSHGLPKRSSVPVLKTHDSDGSTAALNYAFVQKAGPQMTDLRCDSWGRCRSKSGIIFSHNFDTDKPVLDYTSIKRI